MKESKARELRQLIYARETDPDPTVKREAQRAIDTLAPDGKAGRRAYALAHRKAQKVQNRVEKAVSHAR